MRVQHVLTVLLLVLPTQLTGITTTHHDKKTDPTPPPIIVAEMVDDQMPEDKSNTSDSAERQRRLIPYMTFYLTRDFNRPAAPRQQQYHLVPQKLNSYPDKYIVTTNYQPKYADTPPILYQPKISYTPFLESNKLPGGFTPMHTNAQPIRVEVLRGPKPQQQAVEPNYSSIFDKLLQLKQQQQPQPPQYIVQPQYQTPKLNIATQYFTQNYGTPRPPSKVVTYENFQSEPVQEARYKPIPAKTFIHTYTPANIDISTDNKVQKFENFESLKTYTQIPSPVSLNDHGPGPVKTYGQISPEEYGKSQGNGEQPVKVYQTVQKLQNPSVVPVKLYEEDYQKPLGQERPVVVPVKLYQTVNQNSYQKLRGHNQPALPVKVYQSVTQDSYQNTPDRPSPASVKVYQSLPPVTVEEYQAVNQDEYQKPQSRPVKVYQPIYPAEYQQQPDLQVKGVTPVKAFQSGITEENYQKPQQTVGAVYQSINQDVYQQQQQPQQDQSEPVDSKSGEVVSQAGVRVYQPETQSPQGLGDPIVLRPVYRPVKPFVYPEITTEAQTLVATENPHSLSVILKQLQESNTLPQTLTPDNIDNSIKTLVHILNALKHTQKFQRPIVVAQPGEEGVSDGNEDYEEEEDVLPETVTQNFPANTVEGGTPGKPGIDYPAYANIPATNFNCKKQRYKGFFGDPDTNCQVWHYCDLNGGQASFLCPNGTIFSQVALTCDWWYNVKCATTTQLYVLNERLYKYILPFTPKFPEDYSGPLVDRYLALKFKEMEEKMKKQKKGKTAKPPAEDVQDHERNTLQDIEDESGAETQEHTTIVAPPDEKKNN